MRVGNYSLLIPQGVEQDSGHVRLAHGTQYGIRISNHDHRRCDAEVSIDGKSVGTFRLSAHGTMTLETPPDDPGKGRFTFYAADTQEYTAAAGGAIAADMRGLIQVTFKPEKMRPEPVHVPFVGHWASCGPRGQSVGGEKQELTSAGITGLSGHSNQQFSSVGPIEHDLDGIVTITVRLVTGAAVRPLQARVAGNPIPAPVE